MWESLGRETTPLGEGVAGGYGVTPHRNMVVPDQEPFFWDENSLLMDSLML